MTFWRPRVQTTARAAVIDIGSNSVRLVVYDLLGRAALANYNEKVMAGLGGGLSQTGRLSATGVEEALAALRRYRVIIEGLGVGQVRAIATAAVRAAEDGAAFRDRASAAAGVEVEVLSGEEEARLSALGVMSGLDEPSGVVGDLGGSSVELAQVARGGYQCGETYMLGPLAVDPAELADPKLIAEQTRQALLSSSILGSGQKRFYAVGGAWRAFAKLHMELSAYPLRLLQGYRMTAKEVAQTAKAALATDPASRAKTAAVSGRRANVLPYAAMLLREIFAIGGFVELIVSSYGLREGVLMESPREGGDVLLDGLALSLRLGPGQRRFGEALYGFIAPALGIEADLFPDQRRERARAVRGACLAADCGARLHPDYRDRLAYDLVLRGGYASASHGERAFMALAVGSRYGRRFSPPDKLTSLLDESSELRARQLGALMRLGAQFSGRSEKMLAQASLARADGALVLTVNPKSRDMMSETVTRRLAQAADLLGLASAVSAG